MARESAPSPLALSSKASQFLLFLGAPLVLLLGRSQNFDAARLLKHLETQAVTFGLLDGDQYHLSLHCIDYVVEHTPTGQSRRELTLEKHSWLVYDHATFCTGF